MYMQQRDDPIVIRVESRSYMEEAVRPLSWIQNSLFYASKNVARGSSPISSLTVLAWAHVPMFILHLSICVGAEVMLWQTAGKRVAQLLSIITKSYLTKETVFSRLVCIWYLPMAQVKKPTLRKSRRGRQVLKNILANGALVVFGRNKRS